MASSAHRLFSKLAVTLFALVILLHVGAQAAAVQSAIHNMELSERTSERGFLYDDKKYGDGSLKKFFFMLKVILKLFGKHWLNYSKSGSMIDLSHCHVPSSNLYLEGYIFEMFTTIKMLHLKMKTTDQKSQNIVE